MVEQSKATGASVGWGVGGLVGCAVVGLPVGERVVGGVVGRGFVGELVGRFEGLGVGEEVVGGPAGASTPKTTVSDEPKDPPVLTVLPFILNV